MTFVSKSSSNTPFINKFPSEIRCETFDTGQNDEADISDSTNIIKYRKFDDTLLKLIGKTADRRAGVVTCNFKIVPYFWFGGTVLSHCFRLSEIKTLQNQKSNSRFIFYRKELCNVKTKKKNVKYPTDVKKIKLIFCQFFEPLARHDHFLTRFCRRDHASIC